MDDFGDRTVHYCVYFMQLFDTIIICFCVCVRVTESVSTSSATTITSTKSATDIAAGFTFDLLITRL